MILKKPYAFLIKYFRVIHLALALPIIYILIKTGNIVSFFSDYIDANYYTAITNIAGTYVNYFMYLAIIFILASGIAIYFLMRKKEKSTKFYFFLILFYLIIFIMLTITHGILSGMELNTLEATTARAYRDISYIFYLPQFFFAAFNIFRGIGFDIKKFNFETDIKELEITDIDSEEFELTLGIEDYKIKRNIRRFLREFKYYVMENQFIFTVLCSIIGIIFATIFYLNFEVYNKNYKESQTLSHNNLTMKVVDSIVTNRDHGGNIFKDNKYYVVINLSIENRSKKPQNFDYNNFFLDLGNRRVYPTLDRAGYFMDCGLPLKKDTELVSGSKNTYVVAFEIQESEVKKEYDLKILEQTTISIGEITPEFKKITLKPEQTIEIENMGETKLGKIVTFEKSVIGYSSFQVKEYLIANSFTYQYQYCYENKTCRELSDKILTNSNSVTLLVLKGTYTLDQSTLYYKAARTDRLFPDHFLSVQYRNNEGVKTAKITNKTPATYEEGLILEVPSEIKEAKEINLLITIRNKRYIVNLK